MTQYQLTVHSNAQELLHCRTKLGGRTIWGTNYDETKLTEIAMNYEVLIQRLNTVSRMLRAKIIFRENVYNVHRID